MQQAVTMSTAPPITPPCKAAITGVRSVSNLVKVACIAVKLSKIAARPSGDWSSIWMAPAKFSSAMPALKCLPALLITSTRAALFLCRSVSTVSNSLQKRGPMVFRASGRFSTRWAMWFSIVREKQCIAVMWCLRFYGQ